jgi:hypothetical protein
MVGVYCMDAREASEVRTIQRENLADAMRVHGCGKSRIMDLHARDAVLHDDPSPLAVDRLGISEKRKAAFDVLSSALRSYATLSNPMLFIALWTSDFVRGIVDIRSPDHAKSFHI